MQWTIMQYVGDSRDVAYNPKWIRLVKGRLYRVKKTGQKRNRFYVIVNDGDYAVRIFYDSSWRFRREWRNF